MIIACHCLYFLRIQDIEDNKTFPKLEMDAAAARRLWNDRFAQLHHLLRWQTHLQHTNDSLQSAILVATEYFGYTDQPMVEEMTCMLRLVKFQIEQLFDLIAQKQVALWMLSLRYAQLRQINFEDL